MMFFGALLFFIDYALEVVVLLINFSHDLFLEADLARNPSLHPGAL
jgi:hypothetical protein